LSNRRVESWRLPSRRRRRQSASGPPRAAAIAGIVFSILLITALPLLRIAVSADHARPEVWLDIDPGKVVLALNLIPFVGIAFLWFVGVLRDRLGALEDRFFATVFLGSGLLFLAMLFAGASVLGAGFVMRADMPIEAARSEALTLGRALTSNIVNNYAIKMAAVFMICPLKLRSLLYLRRGPERCQWMHRAR
jgi:hypothetical protein